MSVYKRLPGFYNIVFDGGKSGKCWTKGTLLPWDAEKTLARRHPELVVVREIMTSALIGSQLKLHLRVRNLRCSLMDNPNRFIVSSMSWTPFAVRVNGGTELTIFNVEEAILDDPYGERAPTGRRPLVSCELEIHLVSGNPVEGVAIYQY